MAWELRGNASTNPANDFLGTTDTKPLIIQPGNGNVGIGTKTPDTRLNINSNAPNAQAVLVVSDKNADTRVGLWSGFSSGGNSPAIIYTHDLRFGIAQDFSNGAGFSEAMRITRDGNIGIGTPTPSSKIEIAGAQDGLAVTGFQPFITLRDANAGNARCFLQCADGHLGMFPEGAGGVFVQAGTGNVGIGTNSPSCQLSVVTAVNQQAIRAECTTRNAIVAVSAGGDPTLFVEQNGGGDLIFGVVGNAGVPFRVLNNGDVQVRGVTLTCDQNFKANFSEVDRGDIIERLAAMPIRVWNYKMDPTGVRHIGPTSQDFHAAFELNGDDEANIASVDAQGIALAAIQGLNEKLNTENAQLRTSLANLERRLAALESNLTKN
jgi:hypothetical protein